MKNFLFKLRKIDYRHIICFFITLGFIFCALLFPSAVYRVIESGKDFGRSIAYYVCEMFNISHKVLPTVTQYSAYKSTVFLPFTFEEFKANWGLYWQAFINTGNIKSYLFVIVDVLTVISQYLIILMPFIIGIYLFFVLYMAKKNNDYNKDSKALIFCRSFVLHFVKPIINWVKDFIAFIKSHNTYIWVWCALWLLYFNIYTIVIEFFAYYFYLIVGFDFLSVYTQVVKLVMDLATPVTFIPVWLWLIVGYFVFNCIRRKVGFAILSHHEMKNRGFINERPIVYMVCGTMGKKKTTTITDMALSQEVMFREKAFEMILENDLKFPEFPWINLENEIKRAIGNRLIYNLATCQRYIRHIRECFNASFVVGKSVNKSISRHLKRAYSYSYNNLIFDYDYARYGLYHDNKLFSEYIWDVLQTYAQLYFIYIVQSSLIISNYSIRTDNVLEDVGNFPLWNNNFFYRDSSLLELSSRHSHILDFDSLRLGKKLLEDSKYADSFEFGVVLITEIGKERGNVIELSDKIKRAETANQKNDLFNSWLKMIRHSGTVDNFPFVRVITDEQRPESWGLDARSLTDIITVTESSETKLALPFFSLAELLYAFIFGRFSSLYYQYRYNRSDNTLPMYLLKKITSLINHKYCGIYNLFGYSVLKVSVENGNQDGSIAVKKYYLSSKKIYSKRFSTDCFSNFFLQKALRSHYGIDDLPEYESEKASFEELSKQNSYFVNDLVKGFFEDKK